MAGLQKITASNPLRTGFMDIFNENVDEIVDSATVQSDGLVKLEKHGGGFIPIDLRPFFYTKTESESLLTTPLANESTYGKVKRATENDALEGLDDIKYMSPANVQHKIIDYFSKVESIGSVSENIGIGNITSVTEVLGRFGLVNQNNFMAEFSASELTANRYVKFPNQDIEVNVWDDLIGVPTTFTPSIHFHPIGQITGLNDALDGKQPLNANLTSLSGLNSTGIVRRSGVNTFVIGTNDPITLTGDVSGTGTTSIAVTLANSGVTAGTYRSVTVDAKGRVIAGTVPNYNAEWDARWNTKTGAFVSFGASVEIAQNLTVNQDLYVFGAFYDTVLSSGTNNQFLRSNGAGGFFWTSLSTAQISNFSANVLAQTLTGLTTGSNTPITSSNTILTAFQNVQAQINAKANTLSGTTNYLPKFTSSTAIGNSTIFDNGTQVAIGTTSPNSLLHLQGNNSSSVDETVLTLRGNGENGKAISFKNAFGDLAQITGTKAGGGALADEGLLKIEVATNSVLSEVARFTYDARLGVGTTAPLATIHSKGGVTMSSGWNRVSMIEATYPVFVFNSNSTKYAGIGYDFSSNLNFWVGASSEDVTATGINSLSIKSSNGYVGIFAANPQFALDVIGTGRFTGVVQFDSIATCSVAPTSANHLTNKAYVDSLSFVKKGDNVKTISLTNITLSGTQTVSGVALVAGDLILVAGQSTASQNGVYVVAAGAWSRATTNDSDSEIRGAYHLVTAGDYINRRYINSNTSTITVGSTSITYTLDFGQENDPVWEAYKTANDLTPSRFANWNTAFGWGNHANLYVDKVSVQSDIAGAKTFTTSVQSPILKAGTDSLNITLSNISTAPRIASTSTLDFLATTRYDWLTSGSVGRMRLTTTGLRVGSTTDPLYRLHISGTTGFEGLISLGNTSQNIPMSSGNVGQFMRRSLVSNGFYNVDVNNWANITVSDIFDIADTYQAKITGATNYLTKKTASNFGDSQVFDDGTSVVIGGTSAIDSAKFSVVGKIGTTTLRVGDNSTGINIGSLAINSTGALAYGATTHTWNVSATEKMSLNSSRLSLATDLELAGKLKVNNSWGEDHFFLKSLGVDGGGNPLGTEWAVMNVGEISDIYDVFASKAYADTNYIKRVTDEGERGFFLYGDVDNTVKEGFVFTNPDTGIMGIHAFRLNGSTIQQYGFQLDKDGLPYWLFADGSRKRLLTENDAVGGGGTWNGGVVKSTIDIRTNANTTGKAALKFSHETNTAIGAEMYLTNGFLPFNGMVFASNRQTDLYLVAGYDQGQQTFSVDKNIYLYGAKIYFGNVEIDMSTFGVNKYLRAVSPTKAQWVS